MNNCSPATRVHPQNSFLSDPFPKLDPTERVSDHSQSPSRCVRPHHGITITPQGQQCLYQLSGSQRLSACALGSCWDLVWWCSSPVSFQNPQIFRPKDKHQTQQNSHPILRVGASDAKHLLVPLKLVPGLAPKAANHSSPKESDTRHGTTRHLKIYV